jgi:thioredoxin reductase
VFLDLGTRAAIPDVPGLSEAKPMTNVEALDLERLPDHLVVLGGGYVGLEFAQAMRRFGSRVTVIDQGPQLAAREDPDIAAGVSDWRPRRVDGGYLRTAVLFVRFRLRGGPYPADCHFVDRWAA